MKQYEWFYLSILFQFTIITIIILVVKQMEQDKDDHGIYIILDRLHEYLLEILVYLMRNNHINNTHNWM